MHKFQFRSPRYRVDLPVRLSFGDAMFTGRCREISQEGMCLELQHTLAVNEVGTASFQYHGVSVEIGVCVVRADSCGGGLTFVFKTDRQRMDIARLLSLVTAGSEPARPYAVE
jgi:hypothetical protein